MPADSFQKVRCADCDWRGEELEMLKAPNPFDPAYEVCGCPRCKEINTLVIACDEHGCWKDSSCGWPDGNGRYRRTCGQHYFEYKNASQKDPPA